MEANPRSLHAIFGPDCQFLVPMFQRPYRWNEADQWQPLWEDVRDLADGLLADGEVAEHFLGAVVLESVDVPTGTMQQRNVIDGQQRLTTLQLLLAAVRDLAGARGFVPYERALARLTANEDPLSTDPDVAFKVWPTVQDRDWFKIALSGNAAAVASAVREPEALIVRAYAFFRQTVDEWLGDGPPAEARLDALVRVLRDSMIIVAIDLSGKDNPQAIFETLNDRGAPLSPSDLVKNLLLQLAVRQGEDAEKLHDKYWLKLTSAYWNADRRQGRIVRPTLDLFLTHYLVNQTEKEVRSNDVYVAFKRWVRSDSTRTAAEHMADFFDYASIFRSWDESEPNTQVGIFFDRLHKHLDTTAAHPVLLELFVLWYRGFITEPELLEALEVLEGYLVRRMIVRANNKNYNRMFVELLAALRSRGEVTVGARIRSFLSGQTDTHGFWPNDAYVIAALTERRTYGVVRSSRIAMVLGAVNASWQTTKTEHVTYTADLEIEHLLPQGWREHWTLSPGDPREQSDIRDNLLHTIGNLTLLTSPLNKDVSNGPWPQKRAAILEHSALNLNRDLPDTWDHDAIAARSKRIAETVCALWLGPSSDEHGGQPIELPEDEPLSPTARRQAHGRDWSRLAGETLTWGSFVAEVLPDGRLSTAPPDDRELLPSNELIDTPDGPRVVGTANAVTSYLCEPGTSRSRNAWVVWRTADGRLADDASGRSPR
jgi:hypothetical protein